MAQRKRTKEQTIIYKTLHRILNIEEHESGVELMCPERLTVPAPLVTPVVLIHW
jgi:hypothetical protein